MNTNNAVTHTDYGAFCACFVSIDIEIDENLVGGVVIKEGDKVIDLSIKARVNELGSQLSVAH
jgi:F0F1-type ATP synthase delta subunit